jgi:hypothetical protein
MFPDFIFMPPRPIREIKCEVSHPRRMTVGRNDFVNPGLPGMNVE